MVEEFLTFFEYMLIKSLYTNKIIVCDIGVDIYCFMY